jgi:hypothetical protein
MRRLATLFALAALPLVAAACSGADAQKAQDLLAQSRIAAQSVHTQGFTMQMNMEAAGKSAAVDMNGGMILKGDSAGDFYATMRTTAAGAAPVDVVLVKRGNSMQMRLNGETQAVPLPTGLTPAASAGFDVNAITPYVKDVTVTTLDVNGRTEDEVTGALDGDALLRNLPGVTAGLPSSLGVSIGSIKVSLFIPRDSHLVETALLDLTMHVAKRSMHLSLSYAVTSVNKPLTFPK